MADEMAHPIVLHFRDGSTERCRCSLDLSIDFASVFVTDDDEASKEVPLSDLKAIFFLGSGDLAVEPTDAPGSLVAVEFFDGEVIRGKAAEYNPERPGFFLFPLDRRKNDRVFVVSSAVASIEVERF